MAACAFKDPEALYKAYQAERISQDFSEADSHTFLRDYIRAEQGDDERDKGDAATNGRTSPPGPYLDVAVFFKTYVFPLVNALQQGESVPKGLARIGLSTDQRPAVLIARLSHLISIVGLEVGLEGPPPLAKSMKTQLNSALIEWVRNAARDRPLPVPTPNMYLLVAWEALLLWHYCLSETYLRDPGRLTQLFHCRQEALPSVLRKLRKGCLHELHRHRQKSNRQDRDLRYPSALRFAPGPMKKTMEGLKHKKLTWLCVFSKCRSAFKRKDERLRTADSSLRAQFLAALDADRQDYLGDPHSDRVKRGIKVFSRYAKMSNAALGRSPRGRPSHDPINAHAAADAKLCMWSCRYRDRVRAAIPNAVRSGENGDFWGLLLTALLVYPLGKSASTVHRWLKTVDSRFVPAALGHVSVLDWFERLERLDVAAFRELVPEVQRATNIGVDDTWSDFWAKAAGRIEASRS